MNNYKYILFDIDGVLARATNSADEIFKENNITIEEFFKNWSSSETVANFEAGNITTEEFAEARRKELKIFLKPEVIINILKARKSVLYDGVEQLLDNLYIRNYKLACLSNTNILHWNSIQGKEVFDRFFCRKFLSFEIELTKPNKEIYLFVLSTLKCEAHEILYFDDSKKNIESAKKLGFNAVHVKDFYDLTDKINNILC